MLALFCALVLFRLLPPAFRARDLRQHVGPLLELAPPPCLPAASPTPCGGCDCTV